MTAVAQDDVSTGLTVKDFRALADYRYAIRRFLRFSEEASRRAGIPPQQYQVLLTLKGYPGREFANIGELAERMQLSHHSMVGLVDRTAERGLVRREPDAEDGRRVNVFVTALGERVLDQLASLHRDELRQMRNDLRPPGLGSPDE